MRGYDDYRKILELWEKGHNKKDISRITGIPRATIRDCIERFGTLANLEGIISVALPESLEHGNSSRPVYIGFIPKKRRYTDEELIEAVRTSISLSQTLSKLGVRPAGGNYATLRAQIKRLGLDTSHFRGQGWARGQKNPYSPRRSMQEILVKNSDYTNTTHLRQRLLSEGYFEHRCLSCGLAEWLGQAIPLELDHINGDRRDHRLENLRLLCPNCHALTPTYRGKNINV